MKLFVVFLAFVALLAGCMSDRPNVLPTSSGSGTATPTDATDLAKLLPDKAPAGYTLVAEQSGPLSLEEAASRETDPEAERKRLTEQGFLRGYARTWESQAGDVIILIVSEFSLDAGATDELTNSVSDAEETGATRFDVPGIPGAIGLTQEEEGDNFHAVAFVRGRRLFVAAVGGGAGHEPSEAIDLAKKIVALL